MQDLLECSKSEYTIALAGVGLRAMAVALSESLPPDTEPSRAGSQLHGPWCIGCGQYVSRLGQIHFVSCTGGALMQCRLNFGVQGICLGGSD